MPTEVTQDEPVASRATRALGWSFANMALGRVSTLVIGIALARILGPEEFGIFAVALVALLAVLSFNELGVSLAIVRWPGDPRDVAPTVATIALLSSGVIYVGCYLGAPAFASAMGAPAATGVVRVLCLSVLVNALVAVPAATLQRGFRQKQKLVADQVTNWGGSILSIVLAIGGHGAYSLAIGQLVGSVLGGILLVVFAPGSLRFGFDRTKARELLRFGLPLAGSSMVVFANANLDKIIVGGVLGPVALGYYVLAVNLSNWPVTAFSQPVRSVAPAALARVQSDPPAMRSMFLTAIGFLGAVTLPACVLLAAVSRPVVEVVYGTAWSPAAPVLVWLALLAVLKILFELCYDYFVVLASTRVVFVVQVIWLVALVPAVWVGAGSWGLAGAAAAQVAVAAVIVAPIYLYELNRASLAPVEVLRRLLLPALAALAVFGVAFLADSVLRPDLVVLLVGGVVALAAIGLLGYRLRGDFRALRQA